MLLTHRVWQLLLKYRSEGDCTLDFDLLLTWHRAGTRVPFSFVPYSEVSNLSKVSPSNVALLKQIFFVSYVMHTYTHFFFVAIRFRPSWSDASAQHKSKCQLRSLTKRRQHKAGAKNADCGEFAQLRRTIAYFLHSVFYGCVHGCACVCACLSYYI